MGLNPEARAIIMEKCINRDKAEMQALSDRVDNLRVATMSLDALYAEAQKDLEKAEDGQRVLIAGLSVIAQGREPVAAAFATETLTAAAEVQPVEETKG